MGFDMSVSGPGDDDSLWINWLRNPFGLERWAELNYRYDKQRRGDKTEPPMTLWHACNDWNTKEPPSRLQFYETVMHYWETISKLPDAFFFFGAADFVYLIVPKLSQFKMKFAWSGSGFIDGMVVLDGGKYVGLPHIYFRDGFDLGDKWGKADYQRWFEELVEIADKAHNHGWDVTVSN